MPFMEDPCDSPIGKAKDLFNEKMFPGDRVVCLQAKHGWFGSRQVGCRGTVIEEGTKGVTIDWDEIGYQDTNCRVIVDIGYREKKACRVRSFIRALPESDKTSKNTLTISHGHRMRDTDLLE